MKISKSLQRSVLLLVTVGLIVPRSCLAQTVNGAPEVQDVALNAAGAFQGQLVDRQGQPIANAPVIMRQSELTLVETKTDEIGRFTIGSLRGGVYQLAVANQARQIRVWSADAAPPSAISNLTFATGDIQRGQGCTIDSCTGTCGGTCAACGHNGMFGFLMNPFVIGAAVAAAIAIPLALDDDDDAS